MRNMVSDIRPGSRFDTFVPQDEGSREVAEGLRCLSVAVAKKIKESGGLDNAKLIFLRLS